MDESQAADDEIERLFALSDREIFTLLAQQVAMGGTSPSPRDGEAIYANARRTLRVRICEHPRVRQLHAVSTHGRTQLVATIADCLGQHFLPAPAMMIAVLLTKEGVESLCRDCWNAGSK